MSRETTVIGALTLSTKAESEIDWIDMRDLDRAHEVEEPAHAQKQLTREPGDPASGLEPMVARSAP